MAQIFPQSANTLSKVSIIVGLVLIAGIGGAAFELGADSSYATNQGIRRTQPIPFSHTHHVGSMGIDCRYCHNTVETSAYANIPPTKTCMNCHSHIWVNSPTLEPVRASYRTDQSIPWVKVHDLPDFVYFNHSIHIKKGVGCETCHGRVDQMPLTYQQNSLLMEWCINCHKNPAPNLRPRSEITTMGYKPAVDQSILGPELVKEYNVNPPTSCSTCHR